MTAPTAPAQQQKPSACPGTCQAGLLQGGEAPGAPVRLGRLRISRWRGRHLRRLAATHPAGYQGMACGGLGLLCFSGETPALQVSNTIFFITPLLLSGYPVAIAFRAGLFNIGVQGQLIAGAILTTVVGSALALGRRTCCCQPVLLAGIIGGMFWAGIAGVLKALTGAHEVVTTIMLNYVAYNLLIPLVSGWAAAITH